MEITIRLPSEHVDRLLQQALQGSPARAILSKAIPPDNGGGGTPLYTIICDSGSIEALQQLASRCCTPALTLINQAIEDAQSSITPLSSRRSPRRG